MELCCACYIQNVINKLESLWGFGRENVSVTISSIWGGNFSVLNEKWIYSWLLRKAKIIELVFWNVKVPFIYLSSGNRCEMDQACNRGEKEKWSVRSHLFLERDVYIYCFTGFWLLRQQVWHETWKEIKGLGERRAGASRSSSAGCCPKWLFGCQPCASAHYPGWRGLGCLSRVAAETKHGSSSQKQGGLPRPGRRHTWGFAWGENAAPVALTRNAELLMFHVAFPFSLKSLFALERKGLKTEGFDGACCRVILFSSVCELPEWMILKWSNIPLQGLPLSSLYTVTATARLPVQY